MDRIVSLVCLSNSSRISCLSQVLWTFSLLHGAIAIFAGFSQIFPLATLYGVKQDGTPPLRSPIPFQISLNQLMLLSFSILENARYVVLKFVSGISIIYDMTISNVERFFEHHSFHSPFAFASVMGFVDLPNYHSRFLFIIILPFLWR